MIKYSFLNSVYALILVGSLINSCKGQVHPHPLEANRPKQAPEIIGPRPISHFGSDADTMLVSQYIRCIFQDSKGRFWFGPASQSVVSYDGETLKYYTRAAFFHGNDHIKEEYNSVHAIAEDDHGHIWFGTDYGVVKYDGQDFRSYTEKDGLTNIRVGRKCILTDQSGTVWVGTRGGVFQYHPSADSIGGPCFSQFDLLPPIIVNDIMEDQDGNIWLASQDQGVFCYDGKTIRNIAEKEGLGDNYAGGMAQDKEGNFWFTMKGGICRYDGQTFTSYTTKDGIGGSEIWGLCRAASGIIWITARGSTTRFDPAVPLSSPTAFTVFTEEDGLNCCVQSMYQDRAGNMWWGTGQGLYRFDGQRFYQVKQDGPW